MLNLNLDSNEQEGDEHIDYNKFIVRFPSLHYVWLSTWLFMVVILLNIVKRYQMMHELKKVLIGTEKQKKTMSVHKIISSIDECL